jgi:hypothetical protein
MLLNGARRGGATAGSGVRNMAGTGAPTHSDGAGGTYPQLEDEIKPRRRRALKGLLWVVVVIALAGVAAAWLGAKATNIGNDLTAAAQLIEPLKAQIESDDKDGAIATVSQLRSHTSAAKEAAGDPLWTLASSIPGLGSNFSAVAEVARSADDVASLSLAPLVNVFDTLDWNTLLPRQLRN